MEVAGIRNYEVILVDDGEEVISRYIGMTMLDDKPMFRVECDEYEPGWEYMFAYSKNNYENIKHVIVDAIYECDDMDEVLNVLTAYVGTGGGDGAFVLDETHCVLVKFSDEAAGEYRSFTEFAEFLHRTIYEETGIETTFSIGGTVKTVADLSSSFSQASSAQRMSNSVKTGGAVHSFKDFVLIKMLEDLPKYKLNEYLELLMDSAAREIFSDPEMTDTAEEFLENSLNASETSRKLYLHRNTLTYRLDKIERATGLNIRKFSDAVVFRMITILSRLIR